MNLVLLIGFTCIAGILAGYLAARLGPVWSIWVLWTGCIILCLCLFVWSSTGNTDVSIGGLFVFSALAVPFAGCAFVAGAIGLVVRRTIAKEP